MDWLTQNWGWIVLALGAIWLFSRGGMAGCGMGGHGSHAGHGGGPARDDNSPGATRGGGVTTIPEKALDPVNGHEVLTAHALSAVYGGRFFFFESAENRQSFEAAPQRYASNAPMPQAHRRHGGC